MAIFTFPHTIRRKKTILFAATVIGCLLSLSVFSSTYAAVILGTGGDGSDPTPGGQGFAHTTKGWGWYRFTVDGSNGQPLRWQDRSEDWASASAKCRNEGATEIIAFLVQTVSGSNNPANAAVYTYPSSWSGFSNQKSPGQGGYNWISIGTAQSAFNSLPPPAGWTFGSNVGWFCSAYRLNWTLSGTTSRAATSVYPGENIRFNSTITNSNEGGTASFIYGPRYFYSSTNVTGTSPSPGNPFPNERTTISNQNGNLGPARSLSVSQTVTVPPTSTANFICGTVGFSPYDEQGNNFGRSRASCARITKPQLSCNGIRPTTDAEVGVPTMLRAYIDGSAADIDAVYDYGSPSFYLRVYDPSGALIINSTRTMGVSGGTRPIVFADNTSSATLTPTFDTAGSYVIQWGVVSDLETVRCSDTFNAVYHPYFATTGGDISSGGDIVSWNENGGGYAGASSQLAALATGNIQSFVTGTGLSGGLGNGSRLAFANISPSGSTYGGRYTVSPYAPSLDTSGMTSLGTSSPDLSTIASGQYIRTAGSMTLSGNLPAGRNVTIVLTSGNLYINGNVTYSYGSLADIPRITVIVQNGNIYVNNAVSEVHGVFYASGDFYSCATANNAPVVLGTTSNYYNLCNRQLSVYGSVTANSLVLSRTYGTVRGSGAPNEPAENFYYSPEVWLAPSSNSNNISGGDWSSFISLPPIL